MPFEVADVGVEVEEGLAVPHASLQPSVEVDFSHALHHVGQFEADPFGEPYGGEVVVVGVQAVDVGIERGLLNDGKAVDVGVEEELAMVAEAGHHVVGMHVRHGAVEMPLDGYLLVKSPKDWGPVGGFAQVGLGAGLDDHVVHHRVAVVVHHLPAMVGELGIEEHAAVVGLKVQVGGADDMGRHLHIHREVHPMHA